MMNIMLSVVLLLLKIVYTSTRSCVFVQNLQVAHRKAISDSWNRTTVTGCITAMSFQSGIIGDVSIGCDSTSIPKLEKDFMNNLDSLWRVYIGSCNIQIIESGAFSNLPKIQHLKIRGNRIKEIPCGIFNVLSSLQTLYIFYSQISNIEDYALSNLRNLESLSLERNKLNHLKREWFTNTTNLRSFTVSNNCIQCIPTGMFDGWNQLEKINLNSNAIAVIDDGTFKDIAAYVKIINLHHNRLSSLSPNTFPDFVFIETLIISGNLFNYLSEEFLQKTHVTNMYIFGNPFKCDCLEKINKISLDKDIKLDDPNDYIYVKPCKNYDVPICGYSQNQSRTCVAFSDTTVTKKIIIRMKEVGYDTLRTDSDEQCAMFDEIS